MAAPSIILFGGDPVPIKDVKDMITRNVTRLKTAGANLSYEAIGITLDKEDLEVFLKTYNAPKVLAFFGVDNYGGQTYSTVILCGLDQSGFLIKDGTGQIVATERWDLYRKHPILSIADIDRDPKLLDSFFV